MPEPVTQDKPTNFGVLLQIAALVCGTAGVLLGGFFVYGAAFPGPCGDNPGPGLGVLESWALDVPTGLLALAVGALVKRGSPRMRKMCLVTSGVTLAMPVIASYLPQRWHCP